MSSVRNCLEQFAPGRADDWLKIGTFDAGKIDTHRPLAFQAKKWFERINNEWVERTSHDDINDKHLQCACGRAISHRHLIQNGDIQVTVGAGCIKTFVSKASNRKKICEFCGSPHSCRFENYCTECQKKFKKKCHTCGLRHNGRCWNCLTETEGCANCDTRSAENIGKTYCRACENVDCKLCGTKNAPRTRRLTTMEIEKDYCTHCEEFYKLCRRCRNKISQYRKEFCGVCVIIDPCLACGESDKFRSKNQHVCTDCEPNVTKCHECKRKVAMSGKFCRRCQHIVCACCNEYKDRGSVNQKCCVDCQDSVGCVSCSKMFTKSPPYCFNCSEVDCVRCKKHNKRSIKDKSICEECEDLVKCGQCNQYTVSELGCKLCNAPCKCCLRTHTEKCWEGRCTKCVRFTQCNKCRFHTENTERCDICEYKPYGPRYEDVYLHVTIDEKESAKRLGARWDPDAKLWWSSRDDAIRKFGTQFAFETAAPGLTQAGSLWVTKDAYLAQELKRSHTFLGTSKQRPKN